MFRFWLVMTMVVLGSFGSMGLGGDFEMLAGWALSVVIGWLLMQVDLK